MKCCFRIFGAAEKIRGCQVPKFLSSCIGVKATASEPDPLQSAASLCICPRHPSCIAEPFQFNSFPCGGSSMALSHQCHVNTGLLHSKAILPHFVHKPNIITLQIPVKAARGMRHAVTAATQLQQLSPCVSPRLPPSLPVALRSEKFSRREAVCLLRTRLLQQNRVRYSSPGSAGVITAAPSLLVPGQRFVRLWG